MASQLSRKQVSELVRPNGPKYITTINMNTPTVGAGSGGTQSVIQAVDLTLPIRGFRLIFKGRVGVTTANYTTANPETILTLSTPSKSRAPTGVRAATSPRFLAISLRSTRLRISIK